MPKADEFLKLTKKDAQNKADRSNFIFRLIRMDDRNFFTYPEDKRDDRVCVEIEQGVVIQASIQ